jgi:hypothetical protein
LRRRFVSKESSGNRKNKDNSRSPSGMTTRRTEVRAAAGYLAP